MKKFKVVGNHTVAGVKPGGTVELEEPQASQLVAGGHVRPVPVRKPVESKGDD